MTKLTKESSRDELLSIVNLNVVHFTCCMLCMLCFVWCALYILCTVYIVNVWCTLCCTLSYIAQVVYFVCLYCA